MSLEPPATNNNTEAQAPAPPALKRSSQFWFNDGNIVLQAENTLFRVHRSILSMHSPIMEACFSFPQPDNAITLEGNHIVQVSDSAKDIGNLCSLIFGLHQFVFESHSRVEFCAQLEYVTLKIYFQPRL